MDIKQEILPVAFLPIVIYFTISFALFWISPSDFFGAKKI